MRTLQFHHVVPGTQVAGHNRIERFARHFRFIPVLVDIVALHDIDTGRHAGLAGQQHNTDGGITQDFTDGTHQTQTRVILLHNDIQQNKGDVVVFCQHIAGFCRRASGEDLQGRIAETESVQTVNKTGTIGGVILYRQ